MDWKKISTEQRKYIALLLLLTAVGIILILLGNSQELPQNISEQNNLPVFSEEKTSLSEESSKERELEKVLASIAGVGKVWVDITFANDGTTEYAYEEQRNENQYQKTLAVVSKGQGNTEAVVVRREEPKIIGVLVVAQGADNPAVEADLLQAVETLLGLAAHEVIIMAGDSEVETR